MTTPWTVIIHGDASAFIHSRDAALRAVPDASVVTIDRSPDFAGLISEAVATAGGDNVAIVEAGYELLPDAMGGVESVLSRGASPVAGTIHVESRDGLQRAHWQPAGASPLQVLGNPRAVSPVWVSRRDRLAEVTFDRELPGLELIDAWLQLMDRRQDAAAILPMAVARVDASRQSRWHALAGSPGYPDVLRRFLQKYRSHVNAGMTSLLLESEVGFGRLRRRHLELLQRRDEALRELAALRAQAAHHRAFLIHHGLDRVDWGSFDRIDPISRDWGYARGGPVDRPYIRAFIARHSSDIKGCVLEVQEDDLARAYGGERVNRCEVIDVDATNPRATIVADLRDAAQIPDARFDCVILTQTAHVVDAADRVLRECHRILRPGGVLLATVPCVSRVCLEYGPSGDFWRVTPAGARELTAKTFGPDVQVEAFGNLQTTIAFLHGLGETEVPADRYSATDPYNPMLVGVRARKSTSSGARRLLRRRAVLLYHRIGPAEHDPFDLAISLERFREHLAVLQARGTIVDLERLLTAGPESLPDRAIAITFDDGYAEHLTDVAPLLEAHRVPATFFVTSAALETEIEYWWDTLERVQFRDDEERSTLHDRFVAATLEERDALLETVRTRAAGPPRRRPLRASELRTLAGRPGVTIGAHSVSHLLLTRQTSEYRTSEMRECRRALESVIGRPVPFFAYPYGGVDEATADAARAEFAFSLDCAGEMVGESFDAARVPRLDVKGWSAAEFERRIDALFHDRDAAPSISFLP